MRQIFSKWPDLRTGSRNGRENPGSKVPMRLCVSEGGVWNTGQPFSLTPQAHAQRAFHCCRKSLRSSSDHDFGYGSVVSRGARCFYLPKNLEARDWEATGEVNALVGLDTHKAIW